MSAGLRAARMINASTGKGRVSLVTGSASPHGLGRAMINKFASEGAKVVVSDLPSRSKEGEEAVAQLNSQYGAGTAMWQTLDVTKESEWKSAITSIESKLGPLDVACLNAGWAGGPVGAVASLDKIDIDSYRRIVDINEIGVVLGLKYSAESMARNNAEEWKAIVTTSSIAGFTAEPGIPIGYTGTKFAVRGITKAAAQLGGPLRIRVNSIHPGAIATEMTQGVGWVDLKTGELSQEAAFMAQMSLADKRFGFPEEVANVALLLAGSEGTYISGQSYVIDVGLWRG